jgi:methionine salvage enolase-phosphatase E1
MFMGFFDTTQGSKTESDSYKKIQKLISEEQEVQAEEILFLTDSPAG